MATDMAPQRIARPRPEPPRQLWQVPTFLLGVAAVVAVAYGRHLIPVDDGASVRRYLDQARAALDPATKTDAATAIRAGERALAILSRSPMADPLLTAEADFLIGSAHARHADDPGADAAQERQLARKHLKQAERLGVTDADKPKLNYRLAKTAVLLGEGPAEIIARLKPAVEIAPDDAAEGFGMLAQTYMRLNPPNAAAALDATQKQLALKDIDPRVAGQARFRMAELLIALGRGKEARPILETIGTDAPQFHVARVLLGRSYENTREWAKAARNWEQARTDGTLKPPEKAAIVFRLGRCYLMDGRAREAAAAWDEVAKLGGPEARAALLKLGELRLETGLPAAVLDAFTSALQGITRPDGWPNAVLPLDEARHSVERVFQQLKSRGEYDLALKVAALFAPIAPPGDADAMVGLVADAKAQAVLEQARQAPADVAAGLHEQARAQFAIAAPAYETAAGKAPAGAHQASWLLNSADRYAKAGLGPQGAAALARLTQLGNAVAPERLAEAWYVLGDALQKRQEVAGARDAFHHCLKMAGPCAVKARLQLALIDFAESRLDEAEQALVENLKQLRDAAPPDASVLEQTEFALADVAYQRESRKKEDEPHDYAAAEQRFLSAIQQYPDSPAVPKARFYLGKYYWYAATQKSRMLDPRANPDQANIGPEERKQMQRQMAESLKRALEQFEKVQEILQARQLAALLPPDEASRLRLAEFSAAECCYFLGRFDETLKRYTVLAERHRLQVEELAALSQMWQCHNALNQPDLSKAILARMQTALDQMSEAAFNGSTEYHKRSFWANWLSEASKPPTPSVTSPGQ